MQCTCMIHVGYILRAAVVVQVAVNASSRDPAVEAVRESMQAAFSAVDNDDILSVSFDGLGSHGRSTEQNGSSFVEGFAEAVEEAAVEAVAEAARLPLQGRAAADGPPVLSLGADDIFWMSKLHNALLEVRHFPMEAAKLKYQKASCQSSV